MKRILYYMLIMPVFLFSLCCTLKAQNVWSLSDCVQYALENNLHVKRQQTEIDRQEIQQQTTKWSRLPDLNATGMQKFDFGRSLNRENTYDDINSQNSAFSIST